MSMPATQTAASSRPTTYRAVVARFTAGGEVVLTAPADADKPDDEMMQIAQHEARFAGIDFGSADVRITEWTERFGA